MIAVVVATTFVSEARSKIVRLGTTGAASRAQPMRPTPRSQTAKPRRPTTIDAPGKPPARTPRSRTRLILARRVADMPTAAGGVGGKALPPRKKGATTEKKVSTEGTPQRTAPGGVSKPPLV